MEENSLPPLLRLVWTAIVEYQLVKCNKINVSHNDIILTLRTQDNYIMSELRSVRICLGTAQACTEEPLLNRALAKACKAHNIVFLDLSILEWDHTCYVKSTWPGLDCNMQLTAFANC